MQTVTNGLVVRPSPLIRVTRGDATTGSLASLLQVVLRSVPGVCNAYLPEDTTLNRFMWVANYFAQQGFYLILDNQFNLDQTATQNTQQWLDRVADPGSLCGRLASTMGCVWQRVGCAPPGMLSLTARGTCCAVGGPDDAAERHLPRRHRASDR